MTRRQPALPRCRQMRLIDGDVALADAYGLDVSICTRAMDDDYTKPATVESRLNEWAAVFSKLPRVDALFVPGEPGQLRPGALALLEKQAANLHRFHPKGADCSRPRVRAGPVDEFFEIPAPRAAWLTGIVYGRRCASRSRVPGGSRPRDTRSAATPTSRTRTTASPLPDWDLAFAVTRPASPICPRRRIWRTSSAHAGRHRGVRELFEGCNDDRETSSSSVRRLDPDAT